MRLLFLAALSVAISSLGNAVTWINVPPGIFFMGSPLTEPDRNENEILHQVTITKNFEMTKYLITQQEWFNLTGNNPSHFQTSGFCADHIVMNGIELCPNNPVEQISWDDVHKYISKLNEQNDGYNYRLPTEAEWERAARAGTKTAYYYGDNKELTPKNAWFRYNSDQHTHPVGTKTANAWGFYDMSGNVWEWLEDHFYLYSDVAVIDPIGMNSSPYHSIRGSGFLNDIPDQRCAVRSAAKKTEVFDDLGFRLVRTKK